MHKPAIDRIRARSRARDRGPWVDDYEMMAKKTVLRRLCRYVGGSAELITAISLEDLADIGLPQKLAANVPPAEPRSLDDLTQEQEEKTSGVAACEKCGNDMTQDPDEGWLCAHCLAQPKTEGGA